MTTGTLIDVDGKTVDGAELSVGNFVAGFQAGHPDTFYSGVLTKTGPEGKFALDFRGQRQADVCLNAEGYMHETFKGIRSGSEDNILTAHPSIGVQGRILDGKTGQPITLFTVEPLGPGDKECISGELHASPEFSGCERIFHAEGRFTVYSQHPEKIKLCAWAPGYAPMQQEIALNRTGALAPVEFRLERERTITGVVQDAAGNPIEGARVFSLPSATAVTGSDGRFELTGLGAAVCEVFPVGRKYAGHKVQVDLTQASTQEIILTIEPE